MASPKSDWQAALKEFADEIKATFGVRLHSLVLYGSRARGDARDDSDVDTLVVLDPLTDFWSDFDRISPVAAELSLAHDVVLSAIPVDARDYLRGTKSFLVNARREGRRVA